MAVEHQFLEFMAGSPQGVLLAQRNGKIVQVNEAAQPLLQPFFDENARLSINDLPWFLLDEQKKIQQVSAKVLDVLCADLENPHHHTLGLGFTPEESIRWFKIYARTLPSGFASEGAELFICLTEISSEIEAKLALHFRSKGQQAFLRIAHGLQQAKENNLVPAVKQLLQEVAQLFAFERAYLYVEELKALRAQSEFCWCQEKAEPSTQELKMLNKLASGQSMHPFSMKLDELGEQDHTLKAFFKLHKLKELTLIPILDGQSKYMGYIGLDRSIPPKYQEKEVIANGMALLSDMIGSNLDRYLNTWRLGERVKELNTIYQVSQLCLQSQGPSLDFLEELIHFVPDGFLYPQDTRIILKLAEREFAGPPLANSGQSYQVDIENGSEETSYLRAELSKGLEFLPEEQQLIRRLAGIIQIDLNRRKTVQDLEASNLRLSKLAESQEFYVLRVDLQGRVNSFSTKFEEDYRWALEKKGITDLHNHSALDTICEHHHQLTIDTVQQCLAEPGKIISVVIDKPALDGGIKHTFWEFVALTNAKGEAQEIQCMGIDITQIMRTNEGLERFKKLSDLSSNGAVISDADGVVQYVNQKFLDFSGLRADDILGQPGERMFHPDFHETRQSIRERLKKEGLVQNLEVDFHFANGKLGSFMFNARRIAEPDQKAWVFYSLVDISERKAQERALQEQKQRFQAIVEAIPDLIFVNDQDGNYLEYYPGYTDREVDMSFLVGKNLRDAHSGPQAQQILAKIRLCLQTRDIQTTQYTRNINGQEHWFEDTLAPLAKDKVLRFIRDITLRREHENQLRRFDIAIHQSPVGIIITNLEGFIEYASPSMQKVSGYQPEQLIGMSTHIFSSGETPREVYREMWKTILSGETWEGELLNRNSRGEHYWERLSISAIKDERGKVCQFMALKENVDQEKRSQKQIEAQKDSFREIAWAQSHGVRAPLANILGLIDAIQQGEDREALLEMLKSEAERLDEVIRQTTARTNEVERMFSKN